MSWFSNLLGGAGQVAAAPITSIIDSTAEAAVKIGAMISGDLTSEQKTEIQKIIIDSAGAINLAEAQSTHLFVSGWRPFIGWVCGFSLAFYYIPQAVMATVVWSLQCFLVLRAGWIAGTVVTVSLPIYPIIFNATEVLGLIASLLGLSISRSWEKGKDVAAK